MLLACLKNAFETKDGNGEIDQGEMEEVFSKLCRIVNCEQQEVDINFLSLLFNLLLNSGGGISRVEQVQPSRGEGASADDGVAHATAPDARRQADQQEVADEEEDEGDEEEEGEHEEGAQAGGDDHLWIPNRRRSSIQL